MFIRYDLLLIQSRKYENKNSPADSLCYRYSNQGYQHNRRLIPRGEGGGGREKWGYVGWGGGGTALC